METPSTFTAFAGMRRLASGDLVTTVLAVKAHEDGGHDEAVLVFDDRTGTQLDFDLRGTPDEVRARLAADPRFAPAPAREEAQEPAPRAGAGRPKLGVVAREVTLLPRHWSWLEEQPSGISATLRRLVDDARKHGDTKLLARRAWEAAGKFMWAVAGNLPEFEEASRALYAKDARGVAERTAAWPEDVRAHVARLVAEAARLEQAALA